MIVIGLSLPGVMGSKYLECSPVSEQKTHRIRRTMNNRTKALNRTKEDRTNKTQTIQLAINNTDTEWLSVLQKGWIVTVQYLQYLIMVLTIAALFFLCVSSWGINSLAAKFYFFQQAHSWPFEKPQRPPAPYVASCLTSRAVLVKFHNCNDSVTRVGGRLQVPTMRSRDILHQAKGGSSWLSPLRSDGSQDNQAGEAGPVEPKLSGGQGSQN